MKLLLHALFYLSILLTFNCFSTLIAEKFDPTHQQIVVWSSHSDRFQAPSRAGARSLKSLLNFDDSTQLVALLNGTIYFEDPNSGKVFWSFSSGSPLYSSFQAPFNQNNDEENGFGTSSGFFIDYGDDWQLYAHGKHTNGLKLSLNIEDFIKITPHVSEDGAVILGSKTTTVFVIDAKSGRLIRTYRSLDSSSTSQRDEEGKPLSNENKNHKDLIISDYASTSQLIYITRTDYTLQRFGPNSDKISWDVKVAMIEAAFLCKNVESQTEFDIPPSHQSRRMVVQRQGKPQSSSEAIPGDENLLLPDSDSMKPLWSRPDKSLEVHHQKRMLSESASAKFIPNDNSEEVPSLPNDSGQVNAHNARMDFDTGLNILIRQSTALSFMFFLVITLLGFIFYTNDLVGKIKVAAEGLSTGGGLTAASSKRKKGRKSGKKNSGLGTKSSGMPFDNGEDGLGLSDSNEKMLLDLNKYVGGDVNGRRIGKLFVSSTEIAKGSNGTIVFEGLYGGRHVAVKRLVQAHHEVAFKEIQNLIVSDKHPNIVRWYGVEYDNDFVYLALEHCSCSLDDLIQISCGSSPNHLISEGQDTKVAIEYTVRLDKVKGILHDQNLWKSNGYPSPLLLSLMRDMVFGLVHLHELGIIHRDLKPQNVLIIKERSLSAKLSDMGISKRLVGDMSSLGHHATGCGSSGWQAPEQLLHGRQTRAVDLFSIGCVLFFCITGGKHPFGERLERDINIVKSKNDLCLLEPFPEAEDLISRLLNHDPELRPRAIHVLHHPMFWNSEMRLSFLRDVSDRVELEHRESGSDLLKALESTAPIALGGKWDGKMEPPFMTNIGHYRRYRYDSVRDLLRVLRNKLNHYRELPKEIQELVGAVPEGYDNYFASRFPKLLIEAYKVVSVFCREEDCFQKYFKNVNV